MEWKYMGYISHDDFKSFFINIFKKLNINFKLNKES
jgi:hypothetical protein